MFSTIPLQLKEQKHEKSRVLASFGRYDFLKFMKKPGFSQKLKKKLFKKWLKLDAFATFCFLHVANSG